MSVLAQTIDAAKNLAAQSSISSISTNARIDYILRYSKQAILVVENDTTTLSEIIGQYLGSLSDHQNSAYVAVSAQHNNIQIRCRIVEQLFGNKLFDPEKSLAVTILNLAKEADQAISIVIENTHLLSLQIIHELCQLAELGKKTKTSIDVVMTGLPDVGQVMAESKSLFAGKVSILEGCSGQLLNFNAEIFKKTATWYKLSTPAMWLISTLILLTVALVSTIELHQRGVFTFSDLLTKMEAVENQKNLAEAAKTVISSIEVNNESQLTSATVKNVLPNDKMIGIEALATNADVFGALMTNSGSNDKSDATKVEIDAKPVIDLNGNDVQTSKVLTINKPLESKSLSNLPVLNNPITNKNEESRNLNGKPSRAMSQWLMLANEPRVSPDYYLMQSKGFVIQYSGFTEYEEYAKFIVSTQSLVFNAYFRWLNGKAFLVLTSNVYSSREAAEVALNKQKLLLPTRGIWIKSLAAIKNEINQFSSAIN